MSAQFKRKYGWHLMAWGIALGYMLLHHTWVLASYDASVREFSKPVMVAEPQQPALSKAAPHSHFHPAPSLRGSELMGVNISEGDCHTVTLSVDVLSSPSFGSESGAIHFVIYRSDGGGMSLLMLLIALYGLLGAVLTSFIAIWLAMYRWGGGSITDGSTMPLAPTYLRRLTRLAQGGVVK